jgi:hypothetical protein
VIVPSHPVEVNEKIESVRLFFSKRSVLPRGPGRILMLSPDRTGYVKFEKNKVVI